MRSRIYTGEVMHHRYGPKPHRFVYRVAAMLLDLDEVESAQTKPKLLSINRFNLFSWYAKDHGDGRSSQLNRRIRALLNEQGFSSFSARIELLCYPRILGFVFNPLSVYYCYDDQERLGVILYEVSNTFSERHTYVIPVGEDAGPIRQRATKSFYVSPFIPMDSTYMFRMRPPQERVGVFIRQTHENRPLLYASFTGTAKALNDRALISVLLKYPLMTVKVIAGIHWEALKLWRKGFAIQPRTPTNAPHISTGSPLETSQHETL